MKKKTYFTHSRVLAYSFVFFLFIGNITVYATDLSSQREESHAIPKSLTLEKAIGLALEHNPNLETSRRQIDVASGRARQSKLWSNPAMTMNAEDWPVKNGQGFVDSKDTVGIVQTIPFFGKKPLDGKIGNSGVQISEAEWRLRRLNLIRDVKIAFYQVLAAEQCVDVERKLVKIAESALDAARKRVISGEAANQEQLRAEIAWEQARTELMNFENELVATQLNLAFYLGNPDLVQSPLSGALAESASVALLTYKPEKWMPMHPSMLAAQANCERAALELRRAQLESYPDVTVNIEGGRLGDFNQPIIQMGVSLPLPLIDRAQGKKQEAHANIRIAEAEKKSISQHLIKAWGITCKRLHTAHEQAISYRERILPKTNEAMQLVQAGFEQGKFGFNDLLDTLRTTAEAHLAYQQKLLNLNIAHAELEALALHEFKTLPPAHSNPSQKKKNKL